MPDQFRTAASFAVHTLVGLLVSVLVAHGIDIGPHYSAIAEAAVLAVVVAAYAALTHWLAARKGVGFWPSTARWAAKLLTFGTGALVPVTPKVPDAVKAVQATQPPTGQHMAG